VISIKATDVDQQRAPAIANSMAEAFVAWSRDTKRESIKAAADEVQRRLDEARIEILALGKKIVDARSTDKNGAVIKDDSLQAELTIATDLYATLAEKLETLRVNEQLENGSGRVVSVAVAEATPVSPKPLRNAALGLVVGLVFGLGLAFLLEYLDNTIKSTDEAERLYGAPVLGQIPLEDFDKGEKRRLTMVQHPGSPAAESYRALRNSLDFVNFQHDIRTLLVVSSTQGEGKSTVAANLAASLSQTGKKVVLVNSDFRRPTTDQFFAVNNLLTGVSSLKAALQRPGDEQLLVLASGKMPPNPSELLGSEKMSELIEGLKDWADWVIVDSPPLLAVADTAAVARWSDGVLMVTRGGISTRENARKGRELLEKVGARVVGVAVWGLQGDGSGTAYGYGGYYYGSYTPTEQRRSKKGIADSGAKAFAATADSLSVDFFTPEKSTGRKVAEFIGRVMAALLGFLVVLTLIAVVVYFADRAFGWGLLQGITQLFGIG
jgi:succinoglycan biosynthesis transport protein ExoP